MTVKTLSTLTYDDFLESPVWSVGPGEPDNEDAELAPVTAVNGRVPANVGEAWCLCSARFADGSEHQATALCRGDSDLGPLMWSVWNGREDVTLVVPPAPPFVLNKQGPIPFAAKFGKALEEVFPIAIRVVAQFVVPPHTRSVIVRSDGVQRS